MVVQEPRSQMTPPRADSDESVFPRWPLWYPVVAVFAGLVLGTLLITALTTLLRAAGGADPDAEGPGLTAASTVIIDLSVVAATVLIASRTERARAWHFGLRGAPLGNAAAATGLGVIAFYLFALVYGATVRPENPQRVVQDLGADTNTLLLVVGAVVVVAIAPVCEEIVFRGFLYRVLRLRMRFWIAAALNGALFGVIHGLSPIVPILAFLGFVLCWAYERAGTLYAPIAIHVINNAIAYAATTDDGLVPAVCIGVLALTACAAAAARSSRGSIARA